MAAVRGEERNAAPSNPSSNPSNIAIRSAATVMLLSDRPDLHVFMMRRTPQAVFGPGATVFPGGAVDASDGAPNERITGLDDLAASGELGLEAGGLARRVRGRARVLRGGRDPLAERSAPDGAIPIDALQAWRDALNAGHATLEQVLETRRSRRRCRALRVFSHWLTPSARPAATTRGSSRRGHPTAKTVCTTTASWSRPRGCARSTRSAGDERGEIELILPTLRSLRRCAALPVGRPRCSPRSTKCRVTRAGRPCVVAEASRRDASCFPRTMPRGRTVDDPTS